MTSNCRYSNSEDQEVLLRVNDQWVKYKGTTSLRKIYYRFYEALKGNKSKVWIYEYECDKVDGAMFPNDFYRSLSCVCLDGVPSYALPQRILLKKRVCNLVKLGNGEGSICTYCGVQT